MEIFIYTATETADDCTTASERGGACFSCSTDPSTRGTYVTQFPNGVWYICMYMFHLRVWFMESFIYSGGGNVQDSAGEAVQETDWPAQLWDSRVQTAGSSSQGSGGYTLMPLLQNYSMMVELLLNLQIEFYAKRTEEYGRQKTIKELFERKIVQLEAQCDNLRAENNVCTIYSNLLLKQSLSYNTLLPLPERWHFICRNFVQRWMSWSSCQHLPVQHYSQEIHCWSPIHWVANPWDHQMGWDSLLF